MALFSSFSALWLLLKGSQCHLRGDYELYEAKESLYDQMCI